VTATKDCTKLSGTFDLTAGNVTFTAKRIAEGWQPMNLRSVALTPVTK
jgi:hypothetical protein